MDRVYCFAELTWFVLLCEEMWMPVVWFWCLDRWVVIMTTKTFPETDISCKLTDYASRA